MTTDGHADNRRALAYPLASALRQRRGAKGAMSEQLRATSSNLASNLASLLTHVEQLLRAILLGVLASNSCQALLPLLLGVRQENRLLHPELVEIKRVRWQRVQTTARNSKLG